MAENENLAISRITNFDVIRQHFGYWPSFHDAEITRVTFEANPGYHASVTFLIVAFETTNSVDEKGYYKLAKHCTIELQFVGIREMEFDYFSHQNVIHDLIFENVGNAIQCTFNSSVGLDAFIVAEEVSVLKLIQTNQ